MNKQLLLAAGLACADPAWAATEWVRGEVVKLVKMEAMTMPFKVKDVAILAPLQVGDKVHFEVLEHDSELIVQKIEVRQ